MLFVYIDSILNARVRASIVFSLRDRGIDIAPFTLVTGVATNIPC